MIRINQSASKGRLSRRAKKKMTMLTAARSTSNDEMARMTLANVGWALRKMLMPASSSWLWSVKPCTEPRVRSKRCWVRSHAAYAAPTATA